MSNVLESSFAMEICVHGKDKSWSLGISAAKKEFDIWFQQVNFWELGYLCSQLTHCCEVLKWCFHKENWFSSILHPVWGWCCLSYLKWWKFEHANFLSLVQSENPLKIHHALLWWVLYVFFSWDTFASPQDPVGRPNPQCHLRIPQKHLVHPSSMCTTNPRWKGQAVAARLVLILHHTEAESWHAGCDLCERGHQLRGFGFMNFLFSIDVPYHVHKMSIDFPYIYIFHRFSIAPHPILGMENRRIQRVDSSLVGTFLFLQLMLTKYVHVYIHNSDSTNFYGR